MMTLDEVLTMSNEHKNNGCYEDAIRGYKHILDYGNQSRAMIILPLLASCYNSVEQYQEVIDLTGEYTKKYGKIIQSIALLKECAFAYHKMGQFKLEQKCIERINSRPKDDKKIIKQLQYKENLSPVMRTCKNCMLMRSGECSGNKVCEHFKYAPTVSEEETDKWPKYGDATYFKRFGKSRNK